MLVKVSHVPGYSRSLTKNENVLGLPPAPYPGTYRIDDIKYALFVVEYMLLCINKMLFT